MAGQPTKYDKRFCKLLIEYFKMPLTKKEKGRSVAADFPSLAGFAIKIGVHRDTLHEWTSAHPEFAEAVKLAKDYQENWLIQNGLKGLVEQPFAIFTAKNVMKWRDKQPGEEDKINIEITLAERMAKARARAKKGDDSGES